MILSDKELYLFQIELSGFYNQQVKAGRCVFYDIGKGLHVQHALWRDNAVLSEVPAQGIDQLGALTDEEVPCPENHGTGLLRGRLGHHETHRRPAGRLRDCFGVGRVDLLALDERLDVGWRNEADLMTNLARAQ